MLVVFALTYTLLKYCMYDCKIIIYFEAVPSANPHVPEKCVKIRIEMPSKHELITWIRLKEEAISFSNAAFRQV